MGPAPLNAQVELFPAVQADGVLREKLFRWDTPTTKDFIWSAEKSARISEFDDFHFLCKITKQ